MTAAKVRRVFCSFGGGGGGAAGFQRARTTLFGETATVELVGGFDVDAYACDAFRYLTGVEQVCIDAREITPAMMRDFAGEESPWVIFGSPPCQGASKLLSTAKSKSAFYAMLNELALVNTRLILDAWAPSLATLPAFVLYENVPNITSRAKGMLAAVRKLLTDAGYVIQDGFHECRHVGDLAQRRKRWFMVARNPAKVPAFLYLPPHKPGKVCGDVLNELPMPGDPAGGPMHALPAISALNWWRLWAIPAGGDWRDLLPDDGTPRRAKFRRHHVENWKDPSVTVGGSGSNGPCAVADPRQEGASTSAPFHHVNHVTGWGDAAGSVTTSPAPSSGAIAVADPVQVRFKGSLGVLGFDQPSGAVTGEAYPSTGGFSVADPRYGFDDRLGVLGEGDVAPAVTGRAGATTGRYSIADSRALDMRVSVNSPNTHQNKWAVTPASEPIGTVTSASNMGEGAPSIAAPLPVPPADEKRFRGWLGVIDPRDPSGVVTRSARPGTGPFSIAAPLPLAREYAPGNGFHDIDKVTPWDAPAAPITGATRPGGGAQSIAQPLPLQPQRGNAGMHHDKYAVRAWDTAALTVHGATRVGSGTQSIAQPLAIKDSPFHEGSGIGRLGVLAPSDMASTITGNARLATGPFSYAAPVPPAPLDLVPRESCYDKGYAVIARDLEPSHTIAGNSAVGCGAYAITDTVPVNLALGCTPHAGAYGVLPVDEPARTITASSNIDNSAVAIADPKLPAFVVLSYEQAQLVAQGHVVAPFAIVDREHPEVALAIVEDMAKPPFRWAETTSARGKVLRKKVTVPLVLISEDGTWHRPLTTLELAVLQGIPWMQRGAAVDFGGGATKQRETIGNMVPMPVGEAFGAQMLQAGIASARGCLFMYAAGGGFWVLPENIDRLIRAGVRRVRQEDVAKIDRDEAVLLDDTARPIRRRSKRSRRRGPTLSDVGRLLPQSVNRVDVAVRVA